MVAAFLITFREVIEASFIVVTVAGLLLKLGQSKGLRNVWLAAGMALIVSALLIIVGSLLGFRLQEMYSGSVEEFTEGVLMIISSVFITWTVFFLHTYFSGHRKHFEARVTRHVERMEEGGIFLLVFTAVIREGFEIALFLSTMYLSANPGEIMIGFTSGIVSGLLVSFLFLSASYRLPINHVIRTSNILLILFAAGMLARGVHELSEVGLIAEVFKVTLSALPEKGTYAADIIKSLFGLSRQMDIIQILLYITYVVAVGWYIFIRSEEKPSVV